MTNKHTDEIITGGGVWRVHLPNLLKEIGGNPQVSILKQPLNILGQIIFDLAERATKINDPALNKIMIQLTLYSVADPLEPDYDAEIVRSYLYGDAGKVKDPEYKSGGSDILELLHDLRFRLENMPPDPAEDENLVSRIMQATDKITADMKGQQHDK